MENPIEVREERDYEIVRNNAIEEQRSLKKTAVGLLDELRSLQMIYPMNFPEGTSLNGEVRKFESYLIQRALDKFNGNQVKAAELLNINYTTLNAKIKRYRLDEQYLSSKRTHKNLSEADLNALDDAIRTRDQQGIWNKLRKFKDILLKLVEEVDALSLAKKLERHEDISLPDEIRRFEVNLIRSALNRTGGNQTRAAGILGIGVTTLNNKIKRYRINPHPSLQR